MQEGQKGNYYAARPERRIQTETEFDLHFGPFRLEGANAVWRVASSW